MHRLTLQNKFFKAGFSTITFLSNDVFLFKVPSKKEKKKKLSKIRFKRFSGLNERILL